MNLQKSRFNNALTSAILTATCLTFAPMSMAADLNTYRTGNSYLKSQAGNPNMCASQCSGDVQCKGWNFLRSGAPDGSGICEFNGQIGNAVQHPYAISGVATGLQYGGSNLVQGQTNTVRIGQAVTVRPQSQYTQAQSTQPQQARTLAASTRTTLRQLTPTANTVTRQRTFAPQAAPQTSPQRNTNPQASIESLSLMEQQKRQGAVAAAIATQSAQPEATQVQQAAKPPAPAQVQSPYDAQRQALEQRAQQQAQYEAHMKAQYEAQMQAQRAAQMQMQAQYAPRQQGSMVMGDATSLYGSLYDTPKTERAAIKLPLYSEHVAAQPDAPIVTSPIAVPTAPVYEAPLAMVGAAPKQ